MKELSPCKETGHTGFRENVIRVKGRLTKFPEERVKSETLLARIHVFRQKDYI
jgi:hypothetical protein